MGETPATPVAVIGMAEPERGVPSRSVSKWAAFLDDVAGFNCEFFGMGERRSGLSRGLDY